MPNEITPTKEELEFLAEMRQVGADLDYRKIKIIRLAISLILAAVIVPVLLETK